MLFLQIIKSVTSNPARAIGKQDLIGSLKVGREADLTVFKIEDATNLVGEDAFGNNRKMSKAICPVMAFRSGKMFRSIYE